MATQSIKGGLIIPDILPIGSAPAFAQLLCDASGEKAAVVFRVPKTGTLDKFEFMTGTVTVNASSQIRCSFEDVSAANGDPDGTQDQYRDIAGSAMVSSGWNVPGLMTSDGTDTGVKRAVTRGQVLAAVVGYSTFTAADIVNVSTLSNFPTVVGFPYADHLVGVPAWSKQTNYPVIALKYNDGTYEYLGVNVWPISAFNTLTLNTGTSPDEIGNIFQCPFPCRASGARVMINTAGAGRDFDVVLYDSDGTTALQTINVDADIQRNAGGIWVDDLLFSATQVLLANTNYRVVIKPTTASNINAYDVTVAAAAIMDAFPGGQNWQRTERTDAGAWTQTTTKRVMIGMLFDGFDDAVSTGGSGGATRLVVA